MEDEGEEIVNYEFLTNVLVRNEIISLERQCLNVIVNNFDRYNQAFLYSSNEALQGNIYSLRRKYSKVILEELYSNGTFHSSHLKFLVNEYLKDLKICSLPIRSSSEIVRVVSEIGHTLNSLEFDTLIRMEASFINTCIPHLPNITMLKICSDCTNETLKLITASCSKLEKLVMVFTREGQDCAFTNGGSKFLCPFENDNFLPNTTLKQLSFSNYGGVQNAVTPEDILFLLDKMKALETLVHPGLPEVLLDQGRKSLLENSLTGQKQFNLTSLNLTDSTFCCVPILKLCLKICPHLQELDMLVQDEMLLDHIAAFPKLERLKLVDMKPGIDLTRFIEMKGNALKVLKIYRFFLSADVLIRNCQKLEYLCLSYVALRAEEGSTEIHSLDRMQKLYVQYSNKVNRRGPLLKILDCCRNLKKLSFANDTLYNLETMSSISRFLAKSVLEKVSFRKCYIHPVFLASVLLNCHWLKTLSLVYMKNVNGAIVDDLFEFLPCKKHCVEVLYCDWRDYIPTSDSEDDMEYFP